MKNKMKKVLIALDYDPTAQKVAETGFSMAKAMNAEIILLHVLSDTVYYSSTEYSPIMGYTGLGLWQLITSVDDLKNATQSYLDKSKQHLGDDTIQTLVKEGDIAESIIKVAKDSHADIIVMGSHSRKWLENILMGSVAENVLHHTSIPLFIVPTKKHK
jgi:nucleotide-binding universal stress UspA family protein